jgi:hypothetical protein
LNENSNRKPEISFLRRPYYYLDKLPYKWGIAIDLIFVMVKAVNQTIASGGSRMNGMAAGNGKMFRKQK